MPIRQAKALNTWLTESFDVSLPIWQILCFAAMVCSVAATIATNMSKSYDVLAKLMQAQVCNAKLEGLHSQTELKSLDVKQSSEQFAKLLTEISFV